MRDSAASAAARAARERGGGSLTTDHLSEMLDGFLAAHAHGAQVCIHAGPWGDAQAGLRGHGFDPGDRCPGDIDLAIVTAAR